MAVDPTKLNDLEMLSLLALGLTAYMKRVDAGEEDPFPYPDALICGFNQLLIICTLRSGTQSAAPEKHPRICSYLGNRAVIGVGSEARYSNRYACRR